MVLAACTRAYSVEQARYLHIHGRVGKWDAFAQKLDVNPVFRASKTTTPIPLMAPMVLIAPSVNEPYRLGMVA